MKESIEREKKILEILSEIYIFLLIIVFPLIVDKTGFFNILECKWYSYILIASTYIFLNIVVILHFLIFEKTNIFKDIKLKWIHWLAIGYLGINIISCFCSPFFIDYNLFVGVGRGEGLIVTSLYVLTFLCVALFAKFKRRYINYFTVASLLLNLIAVLQYVGFNPFNMYQDGIGTHNVSFMTTIGNVDFISAMYCILLTISFSAYVFLDDNKKWEKIIHFLSVLMGAFIIGIIDVQSGKVAFFGTLVLIFPFIISSNKRLSKFMIMISAILMAYCINVVINPEYHYDLNKLGLYFQFNYIVILFIFVIVALLYLSRVLEKYHYDFTSNKKAIKYMYLGIFGIALLGIISLYLINFREGFLYEIHELLHGNFDDDFGTYRIFLWKRTFKIFPDFPIIGSGPDTFAIRFMARFTNDIAKIGPLTINDTAANVYLTMLINIGISGLLIYLSFIFAQIRDGVKNMNSYSRILLIAMTCFLIQDFFNLWLVIVTPVFWLLMALHHKSYEKRVTNVSIDIAKRKKRC